MNAFARPEEAMPYEYTEFPKVETQDVAASIPADASGSFVDFETARNMPAEVTQTVVQTALFQDFKEVLQASEA